MYKLLELSAIWYEKGDRLGLLMALVSLAPMLIFTSLVVLALCTDPPHSTHHLKLLVGQLINELLSVSLKRYLKIPRPPHGPPMTDDDFGMPSRHAQFMGFLVGYWRGRLPGVMRGVGGLRVVVVGAAVLVAWSRCHLLYHSVDQVVVGLLIGFVFAKIYAKIIKD